MAKKKSKAPTPKRARVQKTPWKVLSEEYAEKLGRSPMRLPKEVQSWMSVSDTMNPKQPYRLRIHGGLKMVFHTETYTTKANLFKAIRVAHQATIVSPTRTLREDRAIRGDREFMREYTSRVVDCTAKQQFAKEFSWFSGDPISFR